MKKIFLLLKSYLKTPQYWLKNIKWRRPKTISDIELIFVLGTPRSGTTLLQKILETHSQLFSIQSETAIFSWQNYFDPRKKHFDLPEEDQKILLETGKDNVDFFEKGVKVLMTKNPGKIFIEKTPQHVIHLEFLVKHFPKAKFVHIVRDGRDCYCSARKHPWIPQSKSLKSFASYYKKCLGPTIKLKNEPRLKTIHYESLAISPEKEIASLMDFLNLKFEQSQLDVSKIKNDKRSKLKQFEKLNSPINNSSVGRWHSEMTVKEKQIFRKLAEKELIHFGYSLY